MQGPLKSIDLLKVNGLMGDPAVWAFFQKPGAALLFDMGELDRLQTRDLLKVRFVCVSHTHIDHFIGFDRLLRVNIPHRRLVELAGPPGLVANVRGKLAGYTWNLLDPGQIRFVVHEIGTDGAIGSVELSSDRRFEPAPWKRPEVPPSAFASLQAFDDGTRVDALSLDHKCPSIAYAVQAPRRFHVKEEALKALGVAPGSWIRDLQIALGNGDFDFKVTLAGRAYTAREAAAELFFETSPRPLGYLTDVGFTRENFAGAVRLFKGCELLVSETNYRAAEHAKARDRMHLTTRQAALIAACAGVARLEIFHVSHVYVEEPQAVVAEAAESFAKFREMGETARLAEVEAELAR